MHQFEVLAEKPHAIAYDKSSASATHLAAGLLGPRQAPQPFLRPVQQAAARMLTEEF
jgi:hypothetical protein